jgi:hypothetical protein
MREETPAPPPSIPETLRPVLEAVRLAPSAHNTQPWLVTVNDNETFQIGWDLDRWLALSDPAGEQLAYSLGCAIEAAHTVAPVEYSPAPHLEILGEGGVAGEIRVKGSRDEAAFSLLASRETHRGRFATREVPVPAIAEIEREARCFGLEVAVLQDRRAIRQVAELTRDGAAAILRDDCYVRELLEWTRLTPTEEQDSRDGFTAATLCLDAGTVQLLKVLRRRPALRRRAMQLGMASAMGRMQASRVRSCGALLLLGTGDPSPGGQITAGRGLLRAWVAATRTGVAVQPVHFPLSAEPMRAECLKIFGLSDGQHPVTMLRAGLAKRAAPRSDRLSLERFCSVLPPGQGT